MKIKENRDAFQLVKGGNEERDLERLAISLTMQCEWKDINKKSFIICSHNQFPMELQLFKLTFSTFLHYPAIKQ